MSKTTFPPTTFGFWFLSSIITLQQKLFHFLCICEDFKSYELASLMCAQKKKKSKRIYGKRMNRTKKKKKGLKRNSEFQLPLNASRWRPEQISRFKINVYFFQSPFLCFDLKKECDVARSMDFLINIINVSLMKCTEL